MTGVPLGRRWVVGAARRWTGRDRMPIPIDRGAELVHGDDVSTWPLIRDSGVATQHMSPPP